MIDLAKLIICTVHSRMLSVFNILLRSYSGSKKNIHINPKYGDLMDAHFS